MKTRGIKNREAGLTLVELLLSMSLMVILVTIVGELTYTTVKSMIGSADIGIAQSNGRQVMNQMVTDLRKAGQPWNGGTAPLSTPIPCGVGGCQFCATLYSENLDAFAGSADLADDVACYRWTPPAGTPGTAGYSPGFIEAAHGSGGGSPPAGLYQKITGPRTDIVDMDVQYCRPDGATPGTYTCNNSASGAGILGGWQCVFIVRITIKVARFPSHENSLAGLKSRAVTLKGSSSPRNIIFYATAGVNNDPNSNTVISCCDPADGGNNATWCPPAR